MAEDEAHLPVESLEQLMDDGSDPPAVGALEVPVLHERHERVFGTTEVVARRVDVLGEVEDGSRGLGVGSMQPLTGQQADDMEEDEAQRRREDRPHEDADLGEVQQGILVAQLRDEERHREADAGHGRGRDERGPADRERVSTEPPSGGEPRADGDAEVCACRHAGIARPPDRGSSRASGHGSRRHGSSGRSAG